MNSPNDLQRTLEEMEARIQAELAKLRDIFEQPTTNVCVSCGERITFALEPPKPLVRN
jgi:hypothetical protein